MPQNTRRLPSGWPAPGGHRRFCMRADSLLLTLAFWMLLAALAVQAHASGALR